MDDVEPADDAERVEWYLKKAEAGDADAQYNLAICYDEGKGTAKDERQAAHWCVCPRLRYRLLTLCPAPTDPVPRAY